MPPAHPRFDWPLFCAALKGRMNTAGWKFLEERAFWLLAHGDQAAPREILQGTAPVLRLWRYRRNGSFTSWTILAPVPEDRGLSPRVREIAWDRPLDLQHDASGVTHLKRRQSARPSIRIRDVPLVPSTLQVHLEWASRLPPGLPGPAPPLEVGEDVYGVEGFRSLTHLRFEWAGDGPPDWTPTRLHFTTLLRFLEDSVRERETGR